MHCCPRLGKFYSLKLLAHQQFLIFISFIIYNNDIALAQGSAIYSCSIETHGDSQLENFQQYIEFPATLILNNVSANFELRRFDSFNCIGRSTIIESNVTTLSRLIKFDPTNGFLKVGVNNFATNEFCVQMFDGSFLSLSICNSCPHSVSSPPNSNVFCIPKCCGKSNEIFNSESKCIQPPDHVLLANNAKIDIHTSSVLQCFDLHKNNMSDEGAINEHCINSTKTNLDNKKVYYYGGKHYTCKGPTLHRLEDEPFALLENGSVVLYLHENEEILTLSNEFCLDFELFETQLEPVLVACLPDLGSTPPENSNTVLRKCPDAIMEGSHSIELPASIMKAKVNTRFRTNQTTQQLQCSNSLQQITFNDTLVTPDHEIPQTYFTLDGVLLFDGHYYQPNDYCIEHASVSEIGFKICNFTCNGESNIVCLPKCCPWGSYFNNMDNRCHPSNGQIWTPKFIDDAGGSSEDSQRKIHYKIGLTCKNHHFYSGNNDLRRFEILENGSVLVFSEEGDEVPVEGDFCVDGEFINGSLTAQTLGTCLDDDMDYYDLYEEEQGHIISLIYGAFCLLSSFFLLATIIVYSLIWDKHNIHGWTIFAYSISMFFSLLFFGTGHIMNETMYAQDLDNHKGCVAVGILSHFFMLSTFCWLTTLNFDLWWTFKNLAPASNKSKGWSRFICYLIFCEAVPLFIVCLGLILEKTAPAGVKIILPKYGVQYCFLHADAQGPYFYYLITALLVLNLIFFGYTILIMYGYQKNTKAVRKGQANTQSQVQLFAKLFLVMGVNWIFEDISWLCKANSKHLGWIVFDMINLFQGIAIFIIFVCKRQVLLHLWQKHFWLRPILAPITKLTCCKISGGLEREMSGVSGTKITSTTHNSSSLRHYTVHGKNSNTGIDHSTTTTNSTTAL